MLLVVVMSGIQLRPRLFFSFYIFFHFIHLFVLMWQNSQTEKHTKMFPAMLVQLMKMRFCFWLRNSLNTRLLLLLIIIIIIIIIIIMKASRQQEFLWVTLALRQPLWTKDQAHIYLPCVFFNGRLVMLIIRD